MGNPLALTVWVSDDAKLTTNSGARPRNLGPPVTVTWSKYRGPGAVIFANDRPAVMKAERPNLAFSGPAATSATFSQPGEYILHVTVNDYSGDGGSGFQCCWTTGKMKVTVQP